MVGISGRQAMEDTISGINLPALFLYLVMGNDPNAKIGDGDVHAKDAYGNSAVYKQMNRMPLITATLNSPFSTEKIALLLLFGADVNAKTESGDTALGLALSWQDEPSACYLVRHGAEPDGLSEFDNKTLEGLICKK